MLVASFIARHGEELGFLKKLEEKLNSPDIAIEDIADEVKQRLATLMAGASGNSESLSENTQHHVHIQDPGDSLPFEMPDSGAIRLRSDAIDKVPEYAGTVTLESLAWGRHYGACYPHRYCNCYSYRSPSEMISVSSDPSSLPSNLLGQRFPSQSTALLKEPGLLPSISDSTKLVNFHMTHLAWHHGILHAPTF